MVLLDYSSETLATCLQKVMKKLSNWKDETYYLKTSFFPSGSVDINHMHFSVGTVLSIWYLKNTSTNQYCKIPHYLARSLLSKNSFTFWIGPYAFVNEFETTAEGKYLIDMLKYSRLSTAAQRKVDNILDTYKFWVQVDEQFMSILKERDTYRGGTDDHKR